MQVTITHASTGQVLFAKGSIADGFFDRLRGLLGRTALPADQALLLTDCASIHMFFMLFAIDAVFLDKDYVITDIDHELQPYQISFSRSAQTRHCLEIAAGQAKLLGLKSGDQLMVKELSIKADP